MSILFNIKKIYQKYKYRNLNISKKSRVNVGVNINNPKRVFIGENTYINGGDLVVGNDSVIFQISSFSS